MKKGFKRVISALAATMMVVLAMIGVAQVNVSADTITDADKLSAVITAFKDNVSEMTVSKDTRDTDFQQCVVNAIKTTGYNEVKADITKVFVLTGGQMGAKSQTDIGTVTADLVFTLGYNGISEKVSVSKD